MVDMGAEGVGQWIAQFRKLRGFTQRGLAMRANVAYGTLTKVETGHALASPAVVAAVARALSVNVTQLTGQPFLEELRAARVDQLIEPLRVALDSYDLHPPEDVTARPVDVIALDVTRVCDEAMCDGLVAKAAGEVPGLLDELSVSLAADAGEQGWRALSSTYRCVRHVVLNWGFRDLADIALDRATWAGVNGGDPLVEAVRNRARASNHLRAGAYESGLQLLAAALASLEAAPDDQRRAVMAGHTHLGWAVNAARAGDADVVAEHLDIADRLAQRTGEAPTVGWFGFGPTNVAVHRVATLIETTDYSRAIGAGELLQLPAEFPPTRAAHHHMDLGRAYAAVGRHDQSLTSLTLARNLAPMQTRFHTTTRQTVQHLLAARRRVPEPLANYARWVGL